MSTIELNKFFMSFGTGMSGYKNYFYKDSHMYRIDTIYHHDYESIQVFKNKIDKNETFFEDIDLSKMEPGYMPGATPYPHLSNGKMYDAMTCYTQRKLDQNYIDNQFYNTILSDVGFNFWNLSENFNPSYKIYDSVIWEVMINVNIQGINKSRTIGGYHIFPNEFVHLNRLLEDYEKNAISLKIKQNIEDTEFNKVLNMIGVMPREKQVYLIKVLKKYCRKNLFEKIKYFFS